MQSNMFGAACAFCAGAAIAGAGYALSRLTLQKAASGYAAVQMAKQIMQVAFLVLLFVLGPRTPWDRIWLLAGGCLGLTLPLIWFTYKLVKLNDSLHKKEDSTDGCI